MGRIQNMSKEREFICFFNSHRHWGGGEKWHAETILYLQDKKYSVFFCGRLGSALVKMLYSKVPSFYVQFTNVSFLNPFAYISLIKLFKKYRPHTIILCLPIDVKVAGLAAKIAGVPNIVYRRGSAIPIKNSLYNRFLFSRVITQVIANSQETARTILQNNPNLFPKQQIRVLYNGIQIPPVYSKKEHAIPVIAAAGRLEPQKNFDILIPLAQTLLARSYQFVIKIAGRGELADALHEKIKKQNLTDVIELVGFKNDIYDFFAESDMFVLPSLWEGFGFVLAEAMSQELPLVAFNVSSNPELIVEGENGYLVEHNNVEMFADRVCALLDSAELRSHMGRKGREKVIAEFSAEFSHAQTEKYVLELNKK